MEYAGIGKQPPKLSLQAEQQHSVNSPGTSLLIGEKSEGLVIPV